MTKESKKYSEILSKYKSKAEKKITCPVVCLSFEGVVIEKILDKSSDTISGKPVDGAFDFILSLLPDIKTGIHKSGLMPVIYSSLSKDIKGINAMQSWFVSNGFPDEYISKDILFFPKTKPDAILNIDSKAFCFRGFFPDINNIKNFCPWIPDGK